MSYAAPLPAAHPAGAFARWQVRLCDEAARRLRRMATLADTTLQAVMLGAIRAYAEATLGIEVSGYTPPGARRARYSPCVASVAPRFSIPLDWYETLLPRLAEATGRRSLGVVVRDAINHLWDLARCGDTARTDAAIGFDVGMELARPSHVPHASHRVAPPTKRRSSATGQTA